jgi:hypothetical protein
MDWILNLPEENEIESTAELRLSSESNMIRKTIRYKSGLIVEILQDFEEAIFRVSVSGNHAPLRILNNQVFRAGRHI